MRRGRGGSREKPNGIESRLGRHTGSLIDGDVRRYIDTRSGGHDLRVQIGIARQYRQQVGWKRRIAGKNRHAYDAERGQIDNGAVVHCQSVRWSDLSFEQSALGPCKLALRSGL